MSTRPFEQTVDVETPELVVLTYSLAGVGSRVLAALTDLAICIGAFLTIVIALVALTRSRLGLSFDASASWGIAVLGIAQFLIVWGYYVLFEGLMDGQTPGKRLHRLRVVRDGGYSVTFGTSAVRNLVRMIDMQPVFFYFVGLTSMLFTKRGRRLGDLVAGTIVVREDVKRTADPSRQRREHSSAAAALQTSLDEEQYILLSRFVSRWNSIDPLRRAALASQLAQRFGGALPDDGRPLGQRLLELHEREKSARTRGVASRGDTGAGRERQALIAAGLPRWTAFSATLAKAQKGGLKVLGEEGVREFVSDYRTLSADLARLRTASAGRTLDELFFLGRLVAGAHNLLYRDRGLGLRGGTRYLFTDVPTEIRRSVAPISLAALLLFGPAIIAGVGVARSPVIAAKLLPPAMLERASDGVRRAKDGEGYIDDPQILRPVMSSRIVTNNVQVTFAVFAGGVAAGALSALMLVLNGISIGSVFGLYASKGIARLLIAFVAPHGVLELFAICVAGGGGFLLAAGILLPGDRSRRRALVENGRRAIRLIAGSTFLLVIAGLLEGFVSPIEWWPIEGKLAVSGLTLLFLIMYLRGGRPASRRTVARDPSIPSGDSALALAPAATTRRAT
ncbi:MAG: stage II sporulation protein M [Gemmatimonadota bacterium]